MNPNDLTPNGGASLNLHIGIRHSVYLVVEMRFE
jgi:hypothetical protein